MNCKMAPFVQISYFGNGKFVASGNLLGLGVSSRSDYYKVDNFKGGATYINIVSQEIMRVESRELVFSWKLLDFVS